MIGQLIRRALYRYTASRPARLISRDGTPYLERYHLASLGPITAYLHRFVSGDGDTEVHDHPWRAVSICLAGGYTEERMRHLDPRAGWVSRAVRVTPWKPNALGLRSFHRIQCAEPDTWTLFIHGRRVKGWGFLSRPRLSGVVYHQPFPASDPQWWHDAPLGRDVEREPMG